ncbi:MAG: zinc-ribbon domain-containing protein [Pirellulales bacterium]
MIIWGSTSKDKVLGEGTFFCPSCRGNANFDHHRVSQYFTLYFIPLFQTSNLGEYIECHSCSGQFDPAVTEIPRDQIEALIQPCDCANCGNSNPSEYSECLSCKMIKPDQVFD